MSRFYFHIKHGQVTVLDQEGIELADEQEAAKEAARTWKGDCQAVSSERAIPRRRDLRGG